MFFIGIDLGTSGVKSIVVNKKLEVKGVSHCEYPLIKTTQGYIEQDASSWWECTKSVTKKAIKDSGVDPKQIKSICISSQGISFVPVGPNGNELKHAITWLDTRAIKQKEEISTAFSDEKYFDITGKHISASSVPAKILWLKENEPEILKKTYKIFTAHDYVVYQLCGSAVTDHTLAAGMQLYDLSTGTWSQEILNFLDINKDILPKIAQSGLSAGKILKSAAKEFGISCDTTIAVGGQDQKCAALGAGISQGVATVSLGTAAAITRVCTSRVEDKTIGIPCHPYLINNRWVLEGVVSNACSSLNWLRDTFFANKTYSEISEMAESACKDGDCLFFYPFLSGMGTPFYDSQMRGLLYGLSFSTGKKEIVKSVLEGVAYQIKTNLDILEKAKGSIKEIRIFGGGSGSDVWCRIISSITAKKVVRMSTSETASVGAAILAGIAVGSFQTPDDIAKLIKIKDSFEPDKHIAMEYEKRYAEYLNIKVTLMNREQV